MEVNKIVEKDNFNIAILSGKGGTGKTTVSTNLAIAMNANYIDCDVEEPNGFVFIKPEIHKTVEVLSDFPIVDKEKCTLCGDCVDTCQFNALAQAGKDIVLFKELCHSCGACEIACDYDAISFAKRGVGKIEEGMGHGISAKRGILNIGEPIAITVIRQLLKGLDDGVNIIDCPPGTSCNVVTALRYANSAILVTEPTKFGLHDLDTAIELVKLFDIPFGVVINKDDGKENVAKKYCRDRSIFLIGEIPYSSEIAFAYSNGDILYNTSIGKETFDNLTVHIEEVLGWI